MNNINSCFVLKEVDLDNFFFFFLNTVCFLNENIIKDILKRHYHKIKELFNLSHLLVYKSFSTPK